MLPRETVPCVSAQLARGPLAQCGIWFPVLVADKGRRRMCRVHSLGVNPFVRRRLPNYQGNDYTAPPYSRVCNHPKLSVKWFSHVCRRRQELGLVCCSLLRPVCVRAPSSDKCLPSAT